MVMTDERMYSVREVTERLGVHENTVLRWLKGGQLRGIRLGGKRAGWRIRQSDLERFIDQRANVPEGDGRA
jgi:excisionase family DNA binding protein